MVDHVLRHGLSMAVVGRGVQLNLGRTTMSSITLFRRDNRYVIQQYILYHNIVYLLQCFLLQNTVNILYTYSNVQLCTAGIHICHTESAVLCIFSHCLKIIAILYIGKYLEYTVISTKWLSILTILFVSNNTRICHSDVTDMFFDINIYSGF